ncbi:MAG: winged helix-turn-helix domain-containing protein [Thermoflexia bacterium]|nr:MAG: winged helix-turn-helix domain-containing protein [Thermoflexia bacterium]
MWTLKRVAQVIEREFGVQHHPGWVWYIFREMGWSPQKPERRAQERDEQAIQTWCTEEWEQVKKLQENGWPIVFIDESS